jgi:hypothetical protein
MEIMLGQYTVREGLDVLRRLDLDRIAHHTAAQPVALSVIEPLAEAIGSFEDEFAGNEDHYRHLGVYWGTLDRSGAASFASRISDERRQREFRSGIVAAVARHDFAWAMALANQAQLDRPDYDDIVRRLARKDLGLALQFLDQVQDGSAEIRAFQLGLVADELEAADATQLQALRVRMPRYLEASEFRGQIRAVTVAAARQVMATDPARGLELARAVLDGVDPDGLRLVELEIAAGNRTRLLEVIRSLDDDLLRARHLLDNADGDPAFLEAARQALDKVPLAFAERDRQMARLIRGLTEIDPLQALRLATANSDDPKQLAEAVKAGFELLPEMSDLAKAKAMMDCIPRASQDASLPEIANVYHRQMDLATEILCQLQGPAYDQFLSWLEALGGAEIHPVLALPASDRAR